MKRTLELKFLSGLIFLILWPPLMAQIKTEEAIIRKIWSNEHHNAFTDLLYYQGSFYCSFRQGNDHAGGEDGLVRIIKSGNGRRWKTVALLRKEGYDLRDPKLSVTPDGRIMVIMGGSEYEERKLMSRLPHVSFSDKSGKRFSEPQPVNVDKRVRSETDWIWRVIWHNKTGYTVVYRLPFKLSLLKTVDGINYDLIKEFDNIGDGPNETTVRVMPDGEMIMMVRRETGEAIGLWGRSSPPYTDWSWTEAGMRFGGPNFVALDNDLFIAGTRVYETPRVTGLFLVNREGEFRELMRLPSGGDNSYPGFAVTGGKIYVSYYSSHEGTSSIYFVELPRE